MERNREWTKCDRNSPINNITFFMQNIYRHTCTLSVMVRVALFYIIALFSLCVFMLFFIVLLRFCELFQSFHWTKHLLPFSFSEITNYHSFVEQNGFLQLVYNAKHTLKCITYKWTVFVWNIDTLLYVVNQFRSYSGASSIM